MTHTPHRLSYRGEPEPLKTILQSPKRGLSSMISKPTVRSSSCTAMNGDSEANFGCSSSSVDDPRGSHTETALHLLHAVYENQMLVKLKYQTNGELVPQGNKDIKLDCDKHNVTKMLMWQNNISLA